MFYYSKTTIAKEVLDLSEDSGLSGGDIWLRPYIGLSYNLHKSGQQIYYWFEDHDGGHKQLPTAQDYDLIRSIRKVRRTGAIRFIVNPWGIVLTKVPPYQQEWLPEENFDAVYVGRINFNFWFEKEN